MSNEHSEIDIFSDHAYTAVMKLLELMDRISCARDLVSQKQIVDTILTCYEPAHVADLAREFLRGLPRDHSVPGDIVWTLQGIARDHAIHGDLTWRQQVYVIMRCLDHWDQMALCIQTHWNL